MSDGQLYSSSLLHPRIVHLVIALMPNSTSRGSTKALNMSSTRPWQAGEVTSMSHVNVHQSDEHDRRRFSACAGTLLTLHHFGRLGHAVDERRRHGAIDENRARIELPNVSAGDAGAVRRHKRTRFRGA